MKIEDDPAEFFKANMHHFPHFNALGLELMELKKDACVMRLVQREELLGDSERGILHGGVITTLLDSVAGAAGFSGMEPGHTLATLDLRIDYMRPAEKGRDILAEAECYHITRNVAFTHAWAYHESRDKVIATAAGTFALNDISRWASGNAAMEMASKLMGGQS